MFFLYTFDFYLYLFISEENALHTLVGIYTGSNSELQVEAGWCITNIAAGTHNHAMTVMKYVAPYLASYLSGDNYLLQVSKLGKYCHQLDV